MTITKIDLGSFSMTIKNGRLAAALETLDTDHDTVVDAKDIQLPIGVKDEGIRNMLLKKAVAAAFVTSGSIAEYQRPLLEDYIDLYRQVQAFRGAVDGWYLRGTVEKNQGKKALAFNYDKYCRNGGYDTLPGHGSFSMEKVGSLAAQIQRVLHGLASGGQNSNASNPNLVISARQSCGVLGLQYYSGITYNLPAIPEELRPSIQQTVRNYLTGAAWLFQFDEAYCGSNTVKWGEHSISGRRGLNASRLARIDAGTSNGFYVTPLPVCIDTGL